MSRRAIPALAGFCFLIVGALVAAVPAGAETVLVSVREMVDGTPSVPPYPSVEGVSSGLFDAGHIVFDAGASGATRTGDLERLARDGGAGWLLQVSVAYAQRKLEKGGMRISGTASFSLVNVVTGETSLADQVLVSNSGREKDVDRTALGVELGRLISQKVARALRAPAL